MTSPYDIGEIFPDNAAEAVRLPRRQVGSSPQGLAVTLLADYTLRTRAWLPSAAIVALLTETGVSQAGARTAISRGNAFVRKVFLIVLSGLIIKLAYDVVVQLLR